MGKMGPLSVVLLFRGRLGGIPQIAGLRRVRLRLCESLGTYRNFNNSQTARLRIEVDQLAIAQLLRTQRASAQSTELAAHELSGREPTVSCWHTTAYPASRRPVRLLG